MIGCLLLVTLAVAQSKKKLLGNIYLALNSKADAITFYKKALAITPGYENAKNRLKELGE